MSPARDPREADNARYGADPEVRGLAAAVAAGIEVELEHRDPGVVRHVALAVSLLVGLRAATSAPVHIDRCAWRFEPGVGVLTFTTDEGADWFDLHAARLVAAAAAGVGERSHSAWFDLWDAAAPQTRVPLVQALGRAAHAPAVVERPAP